MRRALLVFLALTVLSVYSGTAMADSIVSDKGTVTVSCSGCLPDSWYSFLVEKTAEEAPEGAAEDTSVQQGETEEAGLNPDNILYAFQQKSDGEGSFSVTFIHVSLPDCRFLAGGSFPEGSSPRIIGQYAAASDGQAMPLSLETIEEEAFEGSAFERVVLGDSVTAIGAGAFRNCNRLVWISLPDSLTEIAEDAFEGCISVTVECSEGSAAYTYALSHQMTVSIR